MLSRRARSPGSSSQATSSPPKASSISRVSARNSWSSSSIATPSHRAVYGRGGFNQALEQIGPLRRFHFVNNCRLASPYARAGAVKVGGVALIEIEVQNETHQTQTRLKFTAVPRMGEGIRLQEPDGF